MGYLNVGNFTYCIWYTGSKPYGDLLLFVCIDDSRARGGIEYIGTRDA
jgi:hypothetical protein